MAKDEQGSQLNLTVVALVALVAIVGLVALVLNTASLAKISTGGTLVSAEEELPVITEYADGVLDEQGNLVGDALSLCREYRQFNGRTFRYQRWQEGPC